MTNDEIEAVLKKHSNAIADAPTDRLIALGASVSRLVRSLIARAEQAERERDNSRTMLDAYAMQHHADRAQLTAANERVNELEGERDAKALEAVDAMKAQLAARDAAIAAVADAMLQGGDGQTGDYGWNITKLNKARPLIRQIKQPEPDGTRYRHVKRGTVYTVIGEAELQVASGYLVEGAELTIYRGDDGKLWARERHEFHDGRFALEQPEPDKLVEVLGSIRLVHPSDSSPISVEQFRKALAARGGRVVFDEEGK